MSTVPAVGAAAAVPPSDPSDPTAPSAPDRPSGLWPFAVVALLGQLSLGWPLLEVERPAWAAAGTLLFAMTILGTVLVWRYDALRRLAVVPPFALLAVVGLWRHADGASTSGFAPMLGLPVLWLALHGTLRQVWASVAAVGVVLVLPILLVGSPEYTAGDWRRAVLMMGLTAVMGPLTHTLVRDRAAAQARHLEIERRASAELRSQQVINRLLIGNLPDTVVGLLDDDLRWVTVGGQWLDDHDVVADDLVGRRAGEAREMEDPEALTAFLTDGLTEPRHGDFTSAAGSIFAMDAVPVEGPEGERLCLVVSRDVTRLRLAEQQRDEMVLELSASEERFRNTFEDAPIGIALRTVGQGDDDTRFLQVNRAFGLIVGTDPEALAGTPVADLEHPDDHHTVESDGLSASRSQQVRYRHASGRWVWVEISSSYVHDADGRPSYAITQVVDVTSRRASETALLDALERQRTATEGLQEVDRVRTEVMATISHELRTPLTSIGGYLDLLAEGDAGELNEMQGEMVDIALRNTDRLAALIDDLLVLARLDGQDPAKAQERTVDLRELVATTLETFRPLVRRRDQSLEVRLPDAPACVVGDPEQLDRVLVNLVTNASKYTPDGGRVVVDVADADGRVELAVSDTGIGIPVAEQERLFERFFRASTAHEKGIAGTGLGLAIVQAIVERHRGTIGLTSIPGAGSRFAVNLPSAPRPARNGAPTPDRSTP